MAKSILGHGTLNRLFSLELLRRLGNVSHRFCLVVIAVIDHAGPALTRLPPALHFTVLFVLSFLLSVGTSAASYLLLERNYFRRHHASTGGRNRHASAIDVGSGDATCAAAGHDQGALERRAA